MFSWLKTWKGKIQVFATALGAPGIFLISFLDSSFIPFPVINDGLLIALSIRNHSRMPLYAFMASLGSVLGCVLLYFIARRGGEAFFRKQAGARANVIRNWVEKNGFGGMLTAALLPPPTPFKFFVLAAGVFEVPLMSFASAISLARLIRYFGVGFLAVKYGDNAMPFISQHWIAIAVGLALFAVASYAASRLLLKSDASRRLKVEP
ncbi:MAG TPA: VTT domain-containing protein [Candidatus Dormibacteraeota bacterium]|nr:VTT domain-containing protein [Candidatus Dormibacteraeota bacterium]